MGKNKNDRKTNMYTTLEQIAKFPRTRISLWSQQLQSIAANPEMKFKGPLLKPDIVTLHSKFYQKRCKENIVKRFMGLCLVCYERSFEQ